MSKRLRPHEVKVLAAQLRDARAARGVSLKAMENTSGVGYAQISKIERGQFKTLSPKVVAVCKSLQIEPPVSVPLPASTGIQSIAERVVKMARASPAKMRFISLMLDAVDGQFSDRP